MTAHVPTLALRSARRPRALLVCSCALALLVAAHLLDSWALTALAEPKARAEDWHRALRSLGYLPVWLVASAALFLHLRPGEPATARGSSTRGAAQLALSPALAGALAELLKILVRRERPWPDVLGYQFRPWDQEPLSSSGLGMPSSHTCVAFAGAWSLCLLFPRAAPVWLSAAAGCGLTRVLDRAHFLSDVAAGAVVGIGSAALVHGMIRPRSASPGPYRSASSVPERPEANPGQA